MAGLTKMNTIIGCLHLSRLLPVASKECCRQGIYSTSLYFSILAPCIAVPLTANGTVSSFHTCFLRAFCTATGGCNKTRIHMLSVA